MSLSLIKELVIYHEHFLAGADWNDSWPMWVRQLHYSLLGKHYDGPGLYRTNMVIHHRSGRANISFTPAECGQLRGYFINIPGRLDIGGRRYNTQSYGWADGIGGECNWHFVEVLPVLHRQQLLRLKRPAPQNSCISESKKLRTDTGKPPPAEAIADANVGECDNWDLPSHFPIQ